MSSSRSVAAARARRAGGSNNNSTLRPTQMKQQPQYNQTQQQVPQPRGKETPKTPYDSKLSVSDAFALVTIRLGRVETILQKMDVSNLVEKIESGETTSEEAGTNVIIKSLLSRIEDIENKPVAVTEGGMTDEDRETINSVNDRIDDVKAEINDLKNTLFKIQSMVIDLISNSPKDSIKSHNKLSKSVSKDNIVNEVVEVNNAHIDEIEVESVSENNENTDEIEDGQQDNEEQEEEA